MNTYTKIFTKNLMKKIKSCMFESVLDARECANIHEVIIKLHHNYILVDSREKLTIHCLLKAGFKVVDAPL